MLQDLRFAFRLFARQRGFFVTAVLTIALAVVGSASGWLVSVATFGAVVARIPRWLQLVGEPALGGRTAAFAAVMAVVTVVIGGVVPALRASRQAPQGALAAGTRNGSGARRGRHVLLLMQVALATVLLCAGSIMLRSWVNLLPGVESLAFVDLPLLQKMMSPMRAITPSTVRRLRLSTTSGTKHARRLPRVLRAE